MMRDFSRYSWFGVPSTQLACCAIARLVAHKVIANDDLMPTDQQETATDSAPGQTDSFDSPTRPASESQTRFSSEQDRMAPHAPNYDH